MTSSTPSTSTPSTKTVLFSALAVLATLPLASADHQFFTHVFPLLTSRMDPIVNSGAVSAHTHTVYGANNFRSVLSDPNDQLKAVCSTASVQADKSNYWAPTIYLINNEGKYESLLSSGGRAYYNIQGPHVQPFPPGMRIVGGTAMSRDKYSQGVHAVSQAFGCAGSSNWNTYPELPTSKNFPDGCNMIHSQIIFPSCGLADQSLESDGHMSHMVYPIESGGGNAWYKGFDGAKCPPSHPIKYPNIHLEIYYKLTQRQMKMWRKDGSPNFILANGDTNGLSYHADFVNGWEPQVLKDAITKCGGYDNEPSSCPVIAASYKPEIAHQCRFAGMIPDEEQGHRVPLTNLPGCNPRWDANVEKKPSNCPNNVTPGWTPPNAAARWGGDEGTPVPIAIDTADFSKIRGCSGEETWFEGWGSESVTVYNKDKILKGTYQDILKNKNMATAVNKKDKTFGFENANANWRDMKPKTPPPGKEVYQINTNIPDVWIGNGVSQTAPPGWKKGTPQKKRRAAA